MQQTLVEAITLLTDAKTNTPIPFTTIQAVLSVTRFSSTKTPIWRIRIENTDITCSNTKMKISYSCLTCHAVDTITTLSFLRKLNKPEMSYCYKCRNTKTEKRLKHSLWMLGKHQQISSVVEQLDPCAIHAKAVQDFAECSVDWKTQYNNKHMMLDDINRIKPHIISLHNGNISLEYLSQLEYWDIFPSKNQMKFTPVFYDPVKCQVIRVEQPILRCEICDAKWRCKNLAILKTAKKVLCRTCKLCRKTFKVRPYKNVVGTKITYQSKPELNFIEWCSQNMLEVENGPVIPYTYADKLCNYRADFYIPVLGIIIEIKDDHCWHREQVRNGKWEAKSKGVQKFIANNNVYTNFLMITPKNKAECYQQILIADKI